LLSNTDDSSKVSVCRDEDDDPGNRLEFVDINLGLDEDDEDLGDIVRGSLEGALKFPPDEELWDFDFFCGPSF
jgi:hypothetical protein